MFKHAYLQAQPQRHRHARERALLDQPGPITLTEVLDSPLPSRASNASLRRTRMVREAGVTVNALFTGVGDVDVGLIDFAALR